MPSPLRTPPGSRANDTSMHRITHLSLLLLIVGALLIPAVSAELLTDEGSNYATFNVASSASGKVPAAAIGIYRIEDWGGLYLVYLKSSDIDNPSVLDANPSYNMDVTLTIGSEVVGTGTAHYNALYNSEVEITGVQIWLDIDDWHPTGYIGKQVVVVTPASGQIFNGVRFSGASGQSVSSSNPIGFQTGDFSSALICRGIHLARSHYYWENDIHISDEFVSLTRQLDGNEYASTLEITSDAGYLEDTSLNNIDVPYIGTGTWNVTNPFGRIYSGILGSDTPDFPPVTVYVRNSQTGALLANASVVIQDTTTDPWMEVTNQTLPSGQGTIYLPKDPGIHLTQYRIGATVPGYQQVVPALFFRVTGPTNVVVEMEPVEGGPVNEDNAYLEFYVRDLNANGIPNANVLVDGQLRWTNAQGYTQIEVAKNTSYPYSVSKSGYVTIEGTATVADGPRYVVNVVLGPGTVPTYTPTTGETPGGPGATPTPDTRTNEQKGQAIIDLIADFAEPIALLAILATIFGLLKMMTPGRR